MSADDDELLSLRVPRSMAQELVRFASNPVVYISTVISLYVVNTVLNIGAYLVGSILAVYDAIAGVLDAGRVYLVSSFGSAGIQILGAMAAIQEAIGNVVAMAGLAGPPLAIGAGAVILYLTWIGSKRLTLGILQELPGGSTLLGLLGLR